MVSDTGYSMTEWDKAHIQEIIDGNTGNWFTCELLRLIAKSDKKNRERFRLGFPEVVQAYEDWFYGRNKS